MDFDSAVDRLTAQFDVSTTDAAGFLNDRLATMLARSEYSMVKKSLGTTVADQSNYQLDPSLVDLSRVRIDNDGDVTLYDGASLERLWDVDADDGVSVDGHVFALDYQADGDPELRLYPAPDTAGLEITGLYAQLPTEITYGSAAVVPLPADVQPAWLAGGKADCYDVEGRQDLAGKHESQFEAGVAALQKRKNSRADGSGPVRPMVWGFDWR